MIRFQLKSVYTFLIFLCFLGCKEEAGQETTAVEKEVVILPPEELYGDLFYDIQQNENLFGDSKTFVDAVPEKNIDSIRAEYQKIKTEGDSAILGFLKDNFQIPGEETSKEYQTDSSDIGTHIKKLWLVLKRPADEELSGTLIPLPNPYIIPGGRFREIYYWDSYFTMLGLQVDGEVETIQNMVDNFSFLINEFGFIPNGNRTYYLSRSQPPFYALMLDVLAEEKGDSIYAEYLPELEKEYQFWMKGAQNLSENDSVVNRVVRMPDGSILNRYYDDNNTPRPESYREDIKTAEEAVATNEDLTEEEVYRNLRAAAESGWDFSSRWIKPDASGNFNLSAIHTTDILPVDLNSLLYHLEKTIAKAYLISENPDNAREFKERSEDRANAIEKYFWNASKGFYRDYDFTTGEHTSVVSVAGVYPLFFEISSEEKAKKVAGIIESQLLMEGGVVSTPNHSGQQWDAPNGWAPLQWMAYKGLQNYGISALANTIKERWTSLNEKVYKNTYKMTEKYNVEDLSKESGGGEYPTQDGFGWSNGVYKKLTSE
ncbi:alpha,alpha-trehalase TreF [Zunongwangia sp. SCSIO 43204]|uniref:alpha,alpha-trehalase TreF n=1 Tax=Zunongwangia sp. SCSIO 43204 TaxID=2779359 RepID=UPI002105C165|nr:alpha,alpha-trehalase TreF [Zunongwangia sp. SCSIO 43204]UAB82754.1 alpha,alpha-trehalase TreF [Zunongwangia sp. SCSIO 43204]